MNAFDPIRLRNARLRAGLTIAELAKRLNVSAAQVHRLEMGQRRLTVDVLMEVCAALQMEINQLFSPSPRVPVLGVIDSTYEVLPLPANTATMTYAPAVVSDMENIAAVRWEPQRRFSYMFGHIMLFYTNGKGVGDDCWNQRCLLRRETGTQRIGWPVLREGIVHIDGVEGVTEFSVKLDWGSPILAVVSPVLIAQIERSTHASDGKVATTF